jgi:putative tricarboxylic transport membrane protein
VADRTLPGLPDPLEFVSHGPAGSGPHLMLSALAAALAEAGLGDAPPIISAPGQDGAEAIRRVAAGTHGVLGSCTPTYLTTPVVHDMPEKWRTLTPIAGLVADSYLLVARAGEYADPTALFAEAATVAVPKRGGNTDIQAMLLSEATGVQIDVLVEHDPAALIELVVRGKARWTSGVYSDFAADLAAGRLEVLATFDPNPVGEVRNLLDVGIEVSFPLWRGVIAPGSLPCEVISAWDEALRAALVQPAWRNYICAERQRTEFLSAAEFTDLLAVEDERYGQWVSALAR